MPDKLSDADRLCLLQAQQAEQFARERLALLGELIAERYKLGPEDKLLADGTIQRKGP